MEENRNVGTERHGDWNIKPRETRVEGGSVHLGRFLELSRSFIQLAEDGQADAHHCGDIDLDVFFVKVREQLCELTEEAQELLAREDAPTVHRDSVTEESMESFPASDPPAHY